MSDVGDALQGQADVDGVTAAQVVLDGLDDQLHQVTVGTDQHRDEQVTLKTCKKEIHVEHRLNNLIISLFALTSTEMNQLP